jgi:hypothetical protein
LLVSMFVYQMHDDLHDCWREFCIIERVGNDWKRRNWSCSRLRRV